MKLNTVINVCDNFEPGNCKDCPLRITTEREISYQCYETKIKCGIGFSKIVCPLEDISINPNPEYVPPMKGIDKG